MIDGWIKPADRYAAPAPWPAGIADLNRALCSGGDVPARTLARKLVGARWTDLGRTLIHAVPPRVAADCLRDVGLLAAADPAVWHRVKQMKRRSVGVSHVRQGDFRLLLRVDAAERVLDVVDVVDRRDLELKLRRLAE